MTLRSQRSIYVALVALRLIFSILPSYIQPDEYFQSPEITAGWAFDLEIFTPWEFDPTLPARSILPPLLTTGIPFYIYKLVLRYGGLDQDFVSGRYLYILERLSFFFMSFVLDLCILKLCRLCKISAMRSLIVLSSSYVMLTYQCHSFSNSIEALVLATSITLLFVSYPLDDKAAPSNLASFALGISLAFGLFTRITFASFGIFIGIAYLYMAWQRSSRFQAFLFSLFPFTLGMTLTIAIFTVVDSLYFGSLKIVLNGSQDITFDLLKAIIHPTLWSNVSIKGKLTSTIFNNIMYNVDKDNLELHGLHPFYLHAVVNVPLLFGPVGLWAYYKLFTIRGLPAKADRVDMVMVASMSTGLLCLSAFPHQEPRFLSPMLLPAVFLFTRHTRRISRNFWIVWTLFNLVLAIVFGLIHQGGVVPAVIHVGEQSKHIDGCDLNFGAYAICQSDSENTTNFTTLSDGNISLITNLVFYKTFMPPRHLIAYPHHWRDSGNIVINVIDLAGGPIDKVKSVLGSQTYVPTTWVPEDTSKSVFVYKPSSYAFERTLLIMPGTAKPPVDSNRLHRVVQFWPHVNFDDLDKVIEAPSLETLSLSVYLLVSPRIENM
ncbi:Alg9-like mannosyltransferase family-domain-containing protein [Umbelopsis sp. AD052]|nr:Alg9-like mannosyltransferase family-domain-containing protein [Umbelopsis sp. AD052]